MFICSGNGFGLIGCRMWSDAFGLIEWRFGNDECSDVPV